MKETHAVYSPGTKAARAIGWIFLTLLAVLTIFPVLYVIFGSFKSNSELLVGGSNIFPTVWSVANYIQAWQQANFAVYTKNSLILALGVMILSLVTLARMDPAAIEMDFWSPFTSGITSLSSSSGMASVRMRSPPS